MSLTGQVLRIYEEIYKRTDGPGIYAGVRHPDRHGCGTSSRGSAGINAVLADGDCY
jgi:hypothetical protein